MTDLLVLRQLRQLGVSLQYLRRVQDVLVDELRSQHPFSNRRLFTDGRKVFLNVANEMEEESLLEMLSRQHAFPEILKPYLRQIKYDPETCLAFQWRPMPGITIDPTRQFGKPIVDATGIVTSVLAAAYAANQQDEELVASWYGVAPEDVLTAVSFENSLRTAAA